MVTKTARKPLNYKRFLLSEAGVQSCFRRQLSWGFWQSSLEKICHEFICSKKRLGNKYLSSLWDFLWNWFFSLRIQLYLKEASWGVFPSKAVIISYSKISLRNTLFAVSFDLASKHQNHVVLLFLVNKNL